MHQLLNIVINLLKWPAALASLLFINRHSWLYFFMAILV